MRRALIVLAAQALVLWCLTTGPARADDGTSPVTWSLVTAPASDVSAGAYLTGILKATISDGWHLYATVQAANGPKPLVIHVPGGQAAVAAGSVESPAPSSWFDPNFNAITRFYETEATFKLPLEIQRHAAAGKHNLSIVVIFQACNERMCTLPTPVAVHTTIAVKAMALHP